MVRRESPTPWARCVRNGHDENCLRSKLSCEHLRRPFSAERNPTLRTTLPVLEAFGIKLSAKRSCGLSHAILLSVGKDNPVPVLGVVLGISEGRSYRWMASDIGIIKKTVHDIVKRHWQARPRRGRTTLDLRNHACNKDSGRKVLAPIRSGSPRGRRSRATLNHHA